MLKKIIILGGSTQQLPLILRANELGIETHVMDGNDKSIAKKYASFFYNIDFSDKEKVLIKSKEINADGITTIASDVGIVTVNYVAERLGLVGNPESASLYTTNKYEMRKLLSQNKLNTVNYFLYMDDVNQDSLEYPFMVKAADRSGSRGVQLVENTSEYELAIIEAKSVSFNGEVIIEEYVQGTQYSFEVISQSGTHHLLGVTEEFYTGKPYFVEKQHVMPGRIRDEVKNNAFKLIKDCLDVMDIRNGASHIELRITDDEVIKIIEIASRMGGDYRCHLVYNSSGIDFLELLLKVTLGEKLGSITPKYDRASLIKWIIDKDDFELYKDICAQGSDIYLDEVNIDNQEWDNIKDGTERKGCYIINDTDVENCLNIVKYAKVDNTNSI